jgi:hypothetical protein
MRHGRGVADTLTAVSRQWQTPSVADTTGGRMTRSGDRSKELLLKGQAAHWQTPKANDAEKRGKVAVREYPELVSQAQNWPTPKAVTGGANSKRKDRGAGGPDLQEAVKTWPTPAARDYRTPNSQDSQDRRNAGSSRGQQLPNFVEHASHCLRQDQATSKPGAKSSRSTPVLNPLFVELLMGWPIGMTDFDSAVTGYPLWLRRMRTELSRLCSAETEPTAQLSMF